MNDAPIDAATDQTSAQAEAAVYPAVALVDPGSGQFLECNTDFADLVGHDRDEIVQLTWHDIRSPDDDTDRARAEATNRRGKTIKAPALFVTHDGSAVQTEVLLRAIGDIDSDEVRLLLCRFRSTPEPEFDTATSSRCEMDDLRPREMPGDQAALDRIHDLAFQRDLSTKLKQHIAKSLELYERSAELGQAVELLQSELLRVRRQNMTMRRAARRTVAEAQALLQTTRAVRPGTPDMPLVERVGILERRLGQITSAIEVHLGGIVDAMMPVVNGGDEKAPAGVAPASDC